MHELIDNYPTTKDEFSVHFYKPSTSGINQQSILHSRISSQYNDIDGELEGTSFRIAINDPQSVNDGITSILYYMLKFNAVVVIKEGTASRANTIVCFNQLKLMHPDTITSFSTTPLTLILSSQSNSLWNNWEATYNGISSIEMMHPIYLFHDQSAFGFRLVELLRIFRNTDSHIFKLS